MTMTYFRPVLLALCAVLLLGCQSGQSPLTREACATGGDQAKSVATGTGIGAALGGGFAKLAHKDPWIGAAIGGAFGGAGGYAISKNEECPDEEEVEAAMPRPLVKPAKADETGSHVP
jgi:Glycine zipper